MKIKLSKKARIVSFVLIFAAAFSFGLFLECCDTKEFTVTDIPTASYIPIDDTYESHYDDEGRLDINTASAAELDKLDGIGEKLALRIIRYRDEHGAFAAVEELTLVNGIGDSLFEKIKDRICVR